MIPSSLHRITFIRRSLHTLQSGTVRLALLIPLLLAYMTRHGYQLSSLPLQLHTPICRRPFDQASLQARRSRVSPEKHASIHEATSAPITWMEY